MISNKDPIDYIRLILPQTPPLEMRFNIYGDAINI